MRSPSAPPPPHILCFLSRAPHGRPLTKITPLLFSPSLTTHNVLHNRKADGQHGIEVGRCIVAARQPIFVGNSPWSQSDSKRTRPTSACVCVRLSKADNKCTAVALSFPSYTDDATPLSVVLGAPFPGKVRYSSFCPPRTRNLVEKQEHTRDTYTYACGGGCCGRQVWAFHHATTKSHKTSSVLCVLRGTCKSLLVLLLIPTIFLPKIQALLS